MSIGPLLSILSSLGGSASSPSNSNDLYQQDNEDRSRRKRNEGRGSYLPRDYSISKEESQRQLIQMQIIDHMKKMFGQSQGLVTENFPQSNQFLGSRTAQFVPSMNPRSNSYKQPGIAEIILKGLREKTNF